MPRRLANGLTLLSAVVCVLSLLLVGRSFFRSDEVFISTCHLNAWGAWSVDGMIVLSRAMPGIGGFEHDSGDAEVARVHMAQWVWPRLRWSVPELGIGWGAWRQDNWLILPLWLLPLLTAIGPVRWWRRRRKEAGRGFAVDAASAGE